VRSGLVRDYYKYARYRQMSLFKMQEVPWSLWDVYKCPVENYVFFSKDWGCVNMYISKETEEQTEKRLLKVISKADLKIFNGAYTFEEFPISEFRSKTRDTALVYIRDKEVWSQLIPVEDTTTTQDLFKVISFHFPANLDNSGFVGWLATHLKRRIGTGVFVICGQNSSRGGIFDYWGCPYSLGDSFIKEIELLVPSSRGQ